MGPDLGCEMRDGPIPEPLDDEVSRPPIRGRRRPSRSSPATFASERTAPVRRPFPRSRPARLGSAGLILALLLMATTARGQDHAAEASSLARYVPRDNLAIYLEYDGLDAHAGAW